LVNETKSFSMMVVFGSFLLLLGILMDDLSTLILALKGYSVLESNPIAVNYGLPIMFISNFIFYIFILTGFWWIVKMYRKFYDQKGIGYKVYDIFIFLFCVTIVTITVVKINIGYDNYSMLVNEEHLSAYSEQMTQLKSSNFDEYSSSMTEHYRISLSQGLSLIEGVIISTLSFLLFKIDHKVSPWFLD
jgi:hypothetical protein